MLPERDAVIAIMRKAADFQLAEQKKPRPPSTRRASTRRSTTRRAATRDATRDATRAAAARRPSATTSTTRPQRDADNDWIRAAFYTGVMALHETTRDSKYRDAAIAWGEKAKWTPPRDQRHADALACGQTYCELFFLERGPKMIGPFRAAIDRMIETKRPGRVDWWWCDALYMAPPALVRLAHATGDARYAAFMSDLWWDAADFLYDPAENLFYRDKNYFPPAKTKNGKKVFWSRGNGWVMGGIPRVLQYLPADDPHRPRFVKLHQDMSAALLKLQGADGLWRASLHDAEEFPSPETSGTAFFCFAYAWGINNGTLDRATYLPATIKAWNGLVEKVTPDGKLGYVQKVAGSPGAVNAEDTHEYAVGAFLLAGSEMVKLAK
jgi:rhamnogalacturonyl hydrolase YesR